MPKPAWARKARTGPIRKFRQQEFFACEGLIVIYDNRPTTPVEEVCAVSTPDDFVYRAEALAAQSKKAGNRASLKPWERQIQDELDAYARDAKEAAKEAKYMGDPSSPAVQAFWARHRRNSTVSLSAGSNREAYPDLPEVDLGTFTGRTADIDGVAARVDNVPTIHREPRRKPRGKGLILSSDVL